LGKLAIAVAEKSNVHTMNKATHPPFFVAQNPYFIAGKTQLLLVKPISLHENLKKKHLQ
jgi:hypothetical protein